MPIKAVVWDVDDTLFDYARADTAGMHAHLTAEGLLARYGDAEQGLARWKLCTERHWTRFSQGLADFETQRRDRVREFLAAEALSDDEADAWFHRYLGHYESAWSLFPDTVPALDALAEDYRHAVLSNSAARNQEHKLRTLGVRDRFEALLCAAELGVAKPAAEAFLAVCRELALEPAEVAYVGDQPEIDARGAHDAGLLGIWLDRPGALRPAPSAAPVETELPIGVRRITGLTELPALLAADTRFGAPSTFG
ncbi:Pyrimidine 5'-nucleotidase YjjG [Streptomyces sp. YIM 130001]|uniref:HAD family hydrolase n=1 Tax=Streptomyces sp. YIM 130001 TaxID=2259644 RepID=UPI000E64DE55|nr:HAD family hydrolase [Streptomyces sp. YIM 130001]RII09521.1 Pyrimidine 5'-nucleotidase YjjG [Streptomyces sp. YIM 130001]